MRPKAALTAALVLGALAIPAPISAADQPRYVPIRPVDGDFEVIYGDPEKVGEAFVIRIRELPGTIIPPHTHPVDEHITVVQGTFFFAVSETYDPSLLQELKAGSYAFAPAGRTMFGAAPEATIVQVHGFGPFHIHWRHGLGTLDDADAASKFRFAKGQRVVTPRGPGTIEKGYRSGPFIQYEILGSSGELFMSTESDTSLAPAS